MNKLKIGDVTITSIIERDGPWRQPEDMFPAYDPELGRRYLAEMDPVVYDAASNRMVTPPNASSGIFSWAAIPTERATRGSNLAAASRMALHLL